MRVAPGIEIDPDFLQEQFVRASGPGGQNVNKVSTAVQLRLDTAGISGLDPAARVRLARLAGRRMTAEGVIVIDARRFRTRERNREDARERLLALIRSSLHAPPPRRATRPTAGSRERRLTSKKERGGVKRLRRTPREGE